MQLVTFVLQSDLASKRDNRKKERAKREQKQEGVLLSALDRKKSKIMSPTFDEGRVNSNSSTASSKIKTINPALKRHCATGLFAVGNLYNASS